MPMRTAVLVLLAALTGCGLNDSAPPLDEDTFVEIMAQLHVLEARFEIHEDLPAALRDSLLARFDADSTALAETQAFYVQHPEVFRDLYARIIDRINAELGTDGGPVLQ